MELEDVDQFLVDKVKVKLKYWSSTHLPLARITLVVNKVLISSLWYFIKVWVGTKKILCKIKALLCNYLWYGVENAARAWVRWDDCTIPKKVGGWSLTSLEMPCKHLWINGLFRLSSMASQTCKFCWGTVSRNFNLLAMAHGVHPCFGCSPHISLSNMGQKFGTTLLSRGRWWHKRLILFLHHA